MRVSLTNMGSYQNKSKVDEVDENRVTALRFAAQYNHPEIVTYLLSLGSSTKIKAKDGIDPLLSAVEKKHVNIGRILFKAGRGRPQQCPQPG